MPRTKQDMVNHMRSIKVSGMTQIRLELAKQASWKSQGCAPSMREVYKKCEESGTQISEYNIGDLENSEWVIGS